MSGWAILGLVVGGAILCFIGYGVLRAVTWNMKGRPSDYDDEADK